MKRNAVLYGVMLGFVGVCAAIPATTAQAAQPTQHCETTGKPCEITVIVTVCAAGGAMLDHEVTGLVRGQRNIPITWNISSTLPGVEFADRGIEFKGQTSGQFIKQVAAGKTQFKWIGVNSLPDREFLYMVRINRNGFECTSIDPSIVNE